MNNATRSVSNPRYSVPEIRYDLTADTARLDLDSQERLLALSLKWSDRNQALAAEVFDLVPYEVREELDIDRGWRCLIAR
jgi:hypothetical protein